MSLFGRYRRSMEMERPVSPSAGMAAVEFRRLSVDYPATRVS